MDKETQVTNEEQVEASGEVNVQSELAKMKAKLETQEAKLESQQLKQDKLNDDILQKQYLDNIEEENRSQDEGNLSKPEGEEIDRDSLTPSQNYKLLKDEFDARMTQSEADHEKKIAQLENNATVSESKRLLDEAVLRHPELREKLADKHYYDKFCQTAIANGTWNAEEVYHQLQMQEVYDAHLKLIEDQTRADKEHAAMSEKPGSVPKSMVSGKDPTKEEAFSIAWKTHVGNATELPG